ncbi:uncharacterized protein CCDC197 [Paramormyrops kingsleyae]|uniref:uncharacterized protein CCDC197 n=1 Tax=Paramormyrops kingsleyae TaxID=1676925 RepID=UPI003B979801
MEALSLPHIGLNKDDPRLQLKVENRMRNIFVTQIEETRGEENENINHIPIITESPGRLLETGVNTLQRTLVLRKQVEADKVDAQLTLKRQEFWQRMQALGRRRAELELQQQENRDRAAKFEKFVQDNKAKRQRALRKYQVEKKQNELKEKEWEELTQQLLVLEARQQHLKEMVAKHKIHEDYLLKVLDQLPENSLEYSTDSPITPIIRRHETLSLTRSDLLEHLGVMTERLEHSQHGLEALRRDHNISRLMTNRKLSELQAEWDKAKERTKQLEMNLQMRQDQSREWVEEVGSLLIAIRNLGEQCHLQHYGPLENLDLLTTMDMIKEFMVQKSDVEKRVTRSVDLSSNQTGAAIRGGKVTSFKSTSKALLKTSGKNSLASMSRT